MHFSHYDDPHEAWTALMCIENTHNKCGGKVLPVEWIREVLFIKIFLHAINIRSIQICQVAKCIEASGCV